jgi:hypothetical protein
MEHIIALPNVVIWNEERRFPNLTQHGDGSMAFPSKAAYKKYLEDNHAAEVSQGGVVKRPHGNKVVGTWR